MDPLLPQVMAFGHSSPYCQLHHLLYPHNECPLLHPPGRYLPKPGINLAFHLNDNRIFKSSNNDRPPMTTRTVPRSNHQLRLLFLTSTDSEIPLTTTYLDYLCSTQQLRTR